MRYAHIGDGCKNGLDGARERGHNAARMLHRTPGFSGLLAVAALLAVPACGTDSRPKEDLATRSSPLTVSGAGASSTLTIPWATAGSGGSAGSSGSSGSERAGLGFRATLPDALAQGPTALALTDDGRMLIADGENARVAEVVGTDGKQTLGIRTFAGTPKDVRDLAVAPDGAVAYVRQLTSEVTVLDPEGAASGTLSARDLPYVDGLAFGPSRRVIAETSFQESFTLGSAHAPLSRESTLLGKKQGIGQLSLGRLASVIKDDRGVIVLRIHKGDATTAFPLTEATAARIIGARGEVACVRLEHAETSGTALKVTREVQCVNATTGDVVLRRDLGEPGQYVPYRELALGRGRLAFMKPTDKGLVVTAWNVEGAR